MTQVDCSAYDYSCASSRMRGAYEAYPLHRPPSEISDTLPLDADGGAAFRKRVLERLVSTNAPAAAPSRRWWLAATASDDGAVQISKDPEKTRRALEASRLTSLDDRLQAAVSSEGAVPGATVLAAPLSRRLAWTMMDEKYAHDMLFDVAHMARHVAGFEKLVVVALDEPTTRACAAGSISAASAGASQAVRKSNLRRVRPESPRRPPHHRRDACSMAWRCRFLTAQQESPVEFHTGPYTKLNQFAIEKAMTGSFASR